ncbi:MAG: 50S ribosomal protein L18a [Thermoplasmata archaeon]|nr:MAG: 50S ribosomal protein L18a [Thermoplasmata archaeon]
MKAFRVHGEFKMGERWQKFSKEVAANSEEDALEYIYSVFGSRHRVKRRDIVIREVSSLALEDIEDPLVKYLVEREEHGEGKRD